MDHTHPGTCPDCPEPCEVCHGAEFVYRFTLRDATKTRDKTPAGYTYFLISIADAEDIPCPECAPHEPDPDEKYDRRIEDDMYWRGEK